MMPYIIAFKRPEPGKGHPGPWKTAEGSSAFNIEAELCVPDGLDEGEHWELSRVIVFLLRIGRTRKPSHPWFQVIRSLIWR